MCCVDIDPDKVEKTNRGVSIIHEAGLDELLKKNIGNRFSATTDLRQAVLDSDLSLIAVGTPFKENEIDLSFIKEVSQQIGAALREKSTYHAIVVKSTVVPGTTQEVVLPAIEKFSGKRAGADFGVGMNPEFLREGVAVEDFMFPDRIVLGGIDEKTLDALEELYRVFDGVDKIRTTPKTAEMIKYTANSLLATMISFSNEIGNLCAALRRYRCRRCHEGGSFGQASLPDSARRTAHRAPVHHLHRSRVRFRWQLFSKGCQGIDCAWPKSRSTHVVAAIGHPGERAAASPDRGNSQKAISQPGGSSSGSPRPGLQAWDGRHA